MRNILRNTLLFVATAVFGLGLSSCNDLDDLEGRVDSLESRVTALETQINALNGNLETLSALMNSATIYSITESDGVFTITTTNGQTMTITQGATGNTPLVSVDADGYWIVSYDDGASYSRILVDGSPIMASSVYPQFSVDADGYWLVSYDKGATFEQVLDTSGNPVTALGEGSDLFEDVSYDEASGVLTIILSDGYTLEIIVTPDFYCAINDVDYNTPVAFEVGVARNFYVTMHGVAAAFVVVPEGWSATLGDPSDDLALLKVTPPATLTRATADSDSDLSIFATSTKGYSTIAKMSLYLSEAPVPASPSVKLEVGEATASSLEFTVTPNSDVTSWKYMLLLSSEDAPTSETDFDSAETSTETTATVLTFNELEELTEYVLYVLPINDDEEIYGDITFLKASTTEIQYDTYYEKYMAGKDIVIGDRAYNKETYGDGTLITEAGELSDISNTAKNIIFIDSDLDIDYTYSNGIYSLVLIGNNPNKRSSLKTSLQFKLNHQSNSDAEFVLYNFDLDASTATNYLFTHNADGAFDYLAFVNCHIVPPGTSYNTKMAYISSTARYFNSIVISDCVWNFPVTTNTFYIVQIGASNTYTLKDLTVTNNVFYCDGACTDFRIFQGNGTTIEKCTYKNNTIINLENNGGNIRFGTLNSVDVQKNLTYVASPTANFVFFRPNDTTDYTGLPTGTIVSDNIGYGNGAYGDSGNYSWQWFFGGTTHLTTTGFTALEDCKLLSESPFDGGTLDLANEIFTPASTYSSYGAQQ